MGPRLRVVDSLDTALRFGLHGEDVEKAVEPFTVKDLYDATETNAEGTDHEFSNLMHDVVRLMCDEELFTFVLHPEAPGTNNEAERSLRGAAMDRRTGRTSKTIGGARRRTILISVLESLKLHLPQFTPASVQLEIQNWWQTGESLFHRLLRENGLDPPDKSRLEILVPLADAT